MNNFQYKNPTKILFGKGQIENIANEIAVSTHRKLDTFSGRWDECSFSSGICKSLLSQTNEILNIIMSSNVWA